MVLCVSIYYYGHILTNLATFSTTTIKDVSILLFQVYGEVASDNSVWGVIMGMALLGGAVGALFTPCLLALLTRR